MLPYLWMLTGAFAFACMAALAHGLHARCDWQTIALARAALAMVFAAALARAAGVRLVLWRPRTLWIRSIAGSISMLCTFYALPRLPVGDVLTLSNVFPVWVALLSWPVLHEKPSGAVWLAIACALAGVALVAFVEQPQQPHLEPENVAALIVLAGSFSTAVAMIGLHRLAEVDVRAVVVHFSGVAALFCVAALAFFPTTHTSGSLRDATTLLMLLGVGVAATVGQLFLTKAFAAGNPAKVSVVALAQIAFAILFDVVFWGRPLTAVTLAGTALVVCPTAWLMWKESQEHVLDSSVDVL